MTDPIVTELERVLRMVQQECATTDTDVERFESVCHHAFCLIRDHGPALLAALPAPPPEAP